MTDPKVAGPDVLDKLLSGEDGDFLREALRHFLQALMEADVSAQIGAEKYQRSDERLTQRNGYRSRTWETRAGALALKIPKLREGTYFPAFLEPRRRSERALVAVVVQAYVHGVSTRHVEDIVQAMGMTGISKSEVSRMCQELDEVVDSFRTRPLEKRYPYLWLDATYQKVREGGRVVSQALIVAIGVNEEGQREVLGLTVGPSENEETWKEFLRDLVSRGLRGVQLAISDSHQGLRNAIQAVLGGSSWQRCRVHFLRNVAGKVARSAQGMVLAAVRTIFLEPDMESARATLRKTAAMLKEKFPRINEMLLDAEEDLLAHMHFPEEHRKQISSTNPLERLNKEIKRRTRVVEIFPDGQSLIRLSGALLAEQHDEWLVARKYMSPRALARAYQPQALLEEEGESTKRIA